MVIEFDRQEQVDKIQQYIVPGEILYAVYDLKGGGTGFVGLTDKRLIFFDKAFLSKKKAMVSIPYTHVTAIASEDDGKIVFKTSYLEIKTAGGGTYALAFRSGDKAHRAYVIIATQILQKEIAG